MATNYSDDNKRIVLLFSEESDGRGNKVMQKLGFHLVYFMDTDVNTAKPVQGPFIECSPCQQYDSNYQFSGEGHPNNGIKISGIRIVKNARGGGDFGFWKHPNR